MATPAHCAHCFETLSASFEHRTPLTLAQTESLWNDYTNSTTPSSSSSNNTPTSLPPTSSHPLFITWNLISPSSSPSSSSPQKSLRGCIGTFSPQPLSKALSSYALTSAFEDTRFDPIPPSSLPNLQVCVTLLTNFSTVPSPDPLAWELGKHGIRIGFGHKGRRLGATYLPDVAVEQGWTKEEAIVSLMKKAGWRGKRDEWTKVEGFELVTYEGDKVVMEYAEFKEWRDWVHGKGVEAGK